jgi:cytochrome P450
MDIDASSPFSKAFDHASSQIGLRFQNPLYKLTELLTGSSFRAALVEVKRFGRQIVAEARRRRGREAFESLITNTDEEENTLHQQRKNGSNDSQGLEFGSLIDSLIESLSDPQVVADSALNFLSAGRDTTAQSLTWTFYALLRHPGTMRKVLEEIDTAFPGHSVSPEVRAAQLQPASLPYTMAAFYESLRLYPPVPFEIKQTTQPVTLPDGTSLPPHAIVVWCIWAMNRSHDTFGADADEFNPSRWLDTDSETPGYSILHFNGSKRTVGEFSVFNGGPRSCLGKKMAELLACWVLVRVLTEWEFEEVNDGLNMDGKTGERRSANSLTLPMEGGLPVRVRPRRRDPSSKASLAKAARKVHMEDDKGEDADRMMV